MHVLTALIGRALGAQQDDRQLTLVRKEVTELCGKFPIYEGLR